MCSKGFSTSLAVLLVFSCLLPGAVLAITGAFHCTVSLEGKVLAEAEMQLSEDDSALLYTLEVHGIRDITTAQLHLGNPGESSTAVAWLYPSSPPPKVIEGSFEGVLARGTLKQGDLVGPLLGKPISALIEEIQAGNVYVSIQTQDQERGDICGPVILASR
jgi:hypothetical protein